MLRLLELRLQLSRCVGLCFPRLQVSNNGGFSFCECSHDSSREATDWPIGGMRSVDLTDQLTRLRSIPDQAGIKKLESSRAGKRGIDVPVMSEVYAENHVMTGITTFCLIRAIPTEVRSRKLDLQHVQQTCGTRLHNFRTLAMKAVKLNEGGVKATGQVRESGC